MIEVEHLTKRYGELVAVDDISFSVGEGEIVGFLGPNGAGKTTTMRVLTCFMPPTSGKATVAGYDCFAQGLEVRKNIGYLPENVPLYPEMRVREYLSFRAKLKDVPRSERRSRIAEIVERCGIQEVENQIIGTLSKGYRQRVGIADCLVHKPRILILDEPTIGLDPIQIREIRALIKELGENNTILLSTHILPEVEMVCERFIIINRGRIATQGRIDDIRKKTFLRIECEAPEEQVLSAMRSIREVRNVSSSSTDNICHLEVETTGRDIRAEVFRLFASKNWTLRELTTRSQTLEELFIQSTAQEAS